MSTRLKSKVVPEQTLAQSAIDLQTPSKKHKIRFKVTATSNQLRLLKEFFINNNIEYEKLPKPDRDKVIDEKITKLYDLNRQVTIIAMKDKDVKTFKKYEEYIEKCIKEADMEIARWMEVHEPTTFQKLKSKISGG